MANDVDDPFAAYHRRGAPARLLLRTAVALVAFSVIGAIVYFAIQGSPPSQEASLPAPVAVLEEEKEEPTAVDVAQPDDQSVSDVAAEPVTPAAPIALPQPEPPQDVPADTRPYDEPVNNTYSYVLDEGGIVPLPEVGSCVAQDRNVETETITVSVMPCEPDASVFVTAIVPLPITPPDDNEASTALSSLCFPAGVGTTSTDPGEWYDRNGARQRYANPKPMTLWVGSRGEFEPTYQGIRTTTHYLCLFEPARTRP